MRFFDYIYLPSQAFGSRKMGWGGDVGGLSDRKQAIKWFVPFIS